MKIIRYLTRVPKTIPAGQYVVHNFRPRNRQAVTADGFRIFLATFDGDEERGPPCDCGWRNGVVHYETPARRKRREEEESGR